jgi:hypothetical protein
MSTITAQRAAGQSGQPRRIALELEALYLAAATALLGIGPGRYSIDRPFGLRVPRGLTRLTVLGATALTAYSGAQVIRTKLAAAHAESAAASAPPDSN